MPRGRPKRVHKDAVKQADARPRTVHPYTRRASSEYDAVFARDPSALVGLPERRNNFSFRVISP
ncbi:hypothetical protein SCP_1402870 [Sparassis crispa]|uniref:Uncharacterized protein n=1 Tax=Sparassis crispa TaxID=139825 RepID=A0A401H3B0_9APHY|nr:hypothetical protein SCP_1402870 [Sparassis crispa]GBE88879.1 hypothetical protein SCP_1402870 [Sparassis crispa]